MTFTAFIDRAALLMSALGVALSTVWIARHGAELGAAELSALAAMFLARDRGKRKPPRAPSDPSGGRPNYVLPVLSGTSESSTSTGPILIRRPVRRRRGLRVPPSRPIRDDRPHVSL